MLLRAPLSPLNLQAQKVAEIRGDLVEASWGTQIRNYVLHPYKLVKDTRTGIFPDARIHVAACLSLSPLQQCKAKHFTKPHCTMRRLGDIGRTHCAVR